MDILRDSQFVILSRYYFYNIFLQTSRRFSFQILAKFEAAKSGSGVGFLRLTAVFDLRGFTKISLCYFSSSVSQQYKPLGMKNGRIPSRAITVSSKWDRYHGGNRARLQISRRGRYIGAWSAKHNNPYQWIKVDFSRPVKVLAVATQGRQDLSQWVTRYYLSYSFDGINFVDYLCRKVRKENSGFYLLGYEVTV